VEALFHEHNRHGGGFEERHVFCALYRIGLLGWVQHDWVRGEWVQRFLRPGEGTLGPERVLPAATSYLVHPALSDVIGRMNSSYLDRIERATIVGYERPWREAGGAGPSTVRRLCVLKADVRGFGELMLAGTDGPVRQALEEAVRRNTQDAVCVEAGGGDAVLIAHEDPTALAQAARHLIDEVYRAPGQPRLRVALHYGEVHLRQRPGDGPAAIGGGAAVLLATRVEPHVDPGQIWATEEFRERLFEKPSLWRMTPVAGPGDQAAFNIKKGGTEPDLWVRLYRLEF
jgi:class 3 adenylate cyclase